MRIDRRWKGRKELELGQVKVKYTDMVETKYRVAWESELR